MADWSVLDALGQRSMTHQPEQPPNPAIVELARRLRLTGQNLYNTWLAPAQRLGEAATSGTLDVTAPETAGNALGLVGSIAGTRMPFARLGELGSAGGKIRSAAIRTPQGIFEGPNHASIIDILARKYGDGIYKDIEDGFVTTSGKFLDRAEANKLALEQNQHLKPNVIPELFGSEDLRRAE